MNLTTSEHVLKQLFSLCSFLTMPEAAQTGRMKNNPGVSVELRAPPPQPKGESLGWHLAGLLVLPPAHQSGKRPRLSIWGVFKIKDNKTHSS